MTIPFTWRVGVDNEFGWLIPPPELDAPRRLCEVRRIVKDREGVLICLHTGDTVTAPASGRWLWQPLGPDRACAIVGIPPPEVDGAAELERRTDPFHTERHTSPRWRTLVALIRERQLPCGFSVGDWVRGGFDGKYHTAASEAPEIFAAHVAERIARGDPLERAIRAQLADDGALAEVELHTMLVATGWAQALAALARHAATSWREAPAAAATRSTERLDVDDGDEQLALI